MFKFFNRFVDSNDREIKRLEPLIATIDTFTSSFKKFKEKDFSKKTEELRKRIAKGEMVMDILPEAFALAREAASRTIGLRHYDVQLLAGAVLAEGKIAEQKTGEGKTLSAVPALYLHSLTGKGVHLVTVNDYLARRDAGWMGPVFHLLGVSVSAIINDQSFLFDPSFVNETTLDLRLRHLKPISRQVAYQADVVYGINSEFGFDYLRDNMAQRKDDLVQRGYYYAVVDEVDSVLIDEARTPHIISAPDEQPSQKYYEYAKIVDKLSGDTDYKIDEKMRTAHLTDHGIGKIEKLYGIANIYEKDFDTVYHLEAALKARTLFHKEKDYIVRDNEVILVDEFTGRLMVGRRLSEGIHQAIEAKENVPIQRESKTLATVSLQNYFRMYEKLAGMTGTALTEAEEFNKIYKLDVVVIPTHNPIARKDLSDAVYKTTRAKLSAIANRIEEAHKTGQPVLIGTTSIDKNEVISDLLKRRGIKHQVLNAKNHLKEAEIIAEAGKKGAVTVATNMAGRGVDIILGGETPKKEDGTNDVGSSEWKKWQKDHGEVLDLGGLYVIGTERHESRRIDNQLRGRSGRQGDPGVSEFFVALDDDIMRLFGGDKIASMMTRFNMPEDVPLTHPIVSRAIENAQVKVEGFNFDTRKRLVEYDDVLNKQREIIYSRRKKILEVDSKDASSKEEVLAKIDTTIATIVNVALGTTYSAEESANEKIVNEFVTVLPFDDASRTQLIKQLEQKEAPEEKIAFLTDLAHSVYSQREEHFGSETMRQVERFVMQSVIDNLWMDHLDAIDNLRQGIGLRGYAQRDPLVEYKNEAYKMFEKLVFMIDDEVSHRIYKIHVDHASTGSAQAPSAGQMQPGHEGHDHSKNAPVLTPQLPKNMITNTPESEVGELRKNKKNTKQDVGLPSIKVEKIGRNDPCPCGSGLKYKKCGMINAPQHKG